MMKTLNKIKWPLLILGWMAFTPPYSTHRAPAGLSIKIQSDFTPSKAVWGTFGQKRETTVLNEDTKKKHKRLGRLGHAPLGTILFKNKKFFLIKSTQDDNTTHLSVQSFPYHSKILNKKKLYMIDISGHQKELYTIYKNRFLFLAEKNRKLKQSMELMGPDALFFESMICHRHRNGFNCELSVDVEEAQQKASQEHKLNSGEV